MNGMINLSVDARQLRLDPRELSSRLGGAFDETDKTYQVLLDEVIEASRPAYVATRVKLNRENGGITVGSMTSYSSALSKIAIGADFAFALVATLGVGIDRLILKRAQKSPTEAFIIDAIADALVEALCDFAESEITRAVITKPRFSPGYADLELALGRELLAITGADKSLGIRMTQSGLMVPKKSVNALIIIEQEQGRGE